MSKSISLAIHFEALASDLSWIPDLYRLWKSPVVSNLRYEENLQVARIAEHEINRVG